jgi:hypothetical protein
VAASIHRSPERAPVPAAAPPDGERATSTTTPSVASTIPTSRRRLTASPANTRASSTMKIGEQTAMSDRSAAGAVCPATYTALL